MSDEPVIDLTAGGGADRAVDTAVEHRKDADMEGETGDQPTDYAPKATDIVEVEEARISATTLLKIVGVTRVICVDDDFAGDIDDLKDACDQLPGAVTTVSCLGDISFEAPPEIWRDEVDRAWAELSVTSRRVALADAKEKAGLLETDGQLNAGALWAVLGEPIEFLALTPQEWRASSADFLADAAETSTLVLFDKELGGEFDGLKLATELYSQDDSGDIWAGLFTHTVTAATEHEKWEEFAAQPGVVPERFILLAKEHLGPEPVTFPQALKVALMTRPAAILRHSISDAITAQIKTALKELESLSPSEFERIIVGLTQDEGQWEVDMLMRLFDAFLRSEVREALHGKPEVQQATVTLRELAAAATLPTVGTEHAQRIYRRELYEEAEYLNGLHLPIELGDLFKTSTGKCYIVVTQPCDLMVRSNGRRAPDLPFVNLLPVANVDPNATNGIQPGAGSQLGAPVRPPVPTFELPAFDDGSSAWARLDRAVLMPIEALDFCVFDVEGRSVAPVAGGAPGWILPSWAKRFDFLATQAEKLRSRLVGLPNNDMKRRIADAEFGRRSKNAAKLSVDSDHRVSFDLQRFARLRNPYARALLSRFAAHVSRDAFERPMV